MKAMRTEAIELAATIPEKYLPSIIVLMKSFQDISEMELPSAKKKLDLNEYINHGERLFKDAREVEDYIKEARLERFSK